MKVREVKTKNDSVTVKFRYDATGNRKEKRVEKFDTVMITRYMRDASGNVMSIYTDTTVLETPIYGSARLGMYQGQIIEGSQTLGRRSYELSNHLGNVLATITDHINMNADSAWANVTARVITIRSGWRWEDVEKYNFVGFDAGFSRIIKIPTRTKLQKGRNPNGIENGMD